jgi:phosphoribosyl 1,2-cyclic phosphodiesterase
MAEMVMSNGHRTGIGAHAVDYSLPVRNLRITFWGVQGSVAVGPEPEGVDEYMRRVMVYTLGELAKDIARRSKDGIVDLKKLLGGPPSEERIAAYQKTLGLPSFPTYGGETTCVSIETSDGNVLIFDGGTGIRRCANEFSRKWMNRKNHTIHLFGSHEHLDHRAGLPFCRFVYQKPDPFTLQIYGGRQFLDAIDHRYGVFSHELNASMHYDDPIDYRMMSANFRGYQICNEGQEACHSDKVPWEVHAISEPIVIDNTTVTAFDVYHGVTRCLAYKIRHGGKTFVFCTDHEIRRGPDESDPRQQRSLRAEKRLREECMDVDMAYFDGQYFLSEYFGEKAIGISAPVSRLDWGHGCVEDILERSKQCRIKRTFIGHIDPDRNYPEKAAMDELVAKSSADTGYMIQLANGEEAVEL